MPQLLSHILIVLLIYRSWKIFWYEWGGWYIFVFGWSLCLIVIVAIGATHFWTFKGPWIVTPLKIGRLFSWSVLWLYIWTLTIVYTITYGDFSEWGWSYLCWTWKDLIITYFCNYIFLHLKPTIKTNWLKQQIWYKNLPSIYKNWIFYCNINLIYTKYLQLIFIIILICFAININDLPIYSTILVKVGLTYQYDFHRLLLCPIYTYFIIITIKELTFYYYPQFNNGYKHLGIIYRYKLLQPLHMYWSQADAIFINKYITFRELIYNYYNLYNISPFWLTWKQTVIDHSVLTINTLNTPIFNVYKKYIYTSEKLLEIKGNRGGEFKHEIYASKL